MCRLSLCFLAVVFGMALLIATMPNVAEAKPALDEVANIAETLRYLEQLDKYYSQIARPRFGRSIGGQRRFGDQINPNSETFVETSNRR